MSISIKNLPIINEINTDDILLVQTPSRTGIIKFQDFVIGPAHVSFYKDIEDIATDVQILSATVAPYTESFGKIESANQVSSANSKNIIDIQGDITVLTSQLSQLTTLITTLSSTLTTSLNDLNDEITTIQSQISAIEDNVSYNSSQINLYHPE